MPGKNTGATGELKYSPWLRRLNFIEDRSQDAYQEQARYFYQETFPQFRRWFVSVKMLWKSLKGRKIDEDREQEIEEQITNMQDRIGKLPPEIVLKQLPQKLEELHDSLEQLRIDMGLDVPEKQSFDEEKAFVQGLD